MGRFAANTTVPAERTQIEIKQAVMRYGADEFGVMESAARAAIQFRVKGLTVRIDVPLGDITAQEVRQRWRALLLAIRAKLEAVESQISTLETEFMPFVVMPGGLTIGQHLLPRITQVAESGEIPKMLPAPPPVLRKVND